MANSVNGGFHKTALEKLLSVLRQPLFSLPSQAAEKEKPGPLTRAVPAERNRPAGNRTVRPRLSGIPASRQSTAPERRNSAGLFTPLRGSEDFEKIIFVLRACDRYGNRDFNRVLHVERAVNGSRIVATDGRRMHVAEIKARISPGNYRPVATGNGVRLGAPLPGVQFPDWERVVPTDTVPCGSFRPGGKAEMNRMRDSFKKLSGETVNPKYLADLTKKIWTVYRRKEKHKALLLVEQGLVTGTYAVIMPLAV